MTQNSPSSTLLRLLFGLLLTALALGGCTDGEPAPSTGPDAATDAEQPASDGTLDGGIDPDGDPPISQDGAPPDGAVDSDATAEPEPDYSEVLFTPEHLLEIQIELPEASWDTIRKQERGGGIFVGENCMEQPFPSPYTWTEATVTVDGETFETTGIRKKGFFGSVDEYRPSLKIRFDKYVDDQTLHGIKRMTLNNARQDSTILRQCLAYDLFREAGVPAPRCNFAHVVVNGDDLGIYANTEPFKKPFLRRFFDSDEGHLYEGTLSDFREGWTGTIEQKNDEENPYTAPIDAIVEAVQADDETLIEALSGALDLNQFITFWAMEVIVAHWDGYSGNTNNFYFYDDPTSGRVHFIAHGADGTFVIPRRLFEGMPAPRSVNAAGLLARRLYRHPEGKQLYLDRLIELLDAHWDTDALNARVDAMAAVFTRAVPPDMQGRFVRGLGELHEFIDDHGGRIRAEVSLGPAEWDFPLRGNLCVTRQGTVSGSFSTTWGSHPTRNPFATGGGDVDVVFFGDTLDIRDVGSAAGYDQGDRASILNIGMNIDDEILYFARLGTGAQNFEMGTFNIKEDDFGCGFFRYDTRVGEVTFFAECVGTVTFDQASANRGGFVSGTLELEIWGRGR